MIRGRVEAGDRILAYEGPAPSPGPRRRRVWVIVAGLVLLPLLLVVLVGRLMIGRGTGGQFAAQIPKLSADYLQGEGHARRGAKFERLALALNHKALDGTPPTEAEMVQTLGPPDLMQRGPAAGDALFVYFYDRFGHKDWAVLIWFQSGNPTIGYNDASVNASTYAQMRPYAPLPATVPAATGPTSSRRPRRLGHLLRRRRPSSVGSEMASRAQDV